MQHDSEFRKRCAWLAEAASWTAGLFLGVIAFDVVWQAVIRPWIGLSAWDFEALRFAVGKELIASLAAICLVCALSALGKVFGRMGRGQVLVADNAAGLVRAGEWVVASAVAQIFVEPLLGSVLGAGNGPGIDFSWLGLALGLFGGALILLGDVLRSAARAQTELDGIV